jgi:hypothetical protein
MGFSPEKVRYDTFFQIEYFRGRDTRRRDICDVLRGRIKLPATCFPPVRVSYPTQVVFIRHPPAFHLGLKTAHQTARPVYSDYPPPDDRVPYGRWVLVRRDLEQALSEAQLEVSQTVVRSMEVDRAQKRKVEFLLLSRLPQVQRWHSLRNVVRRSG